MTLPSMPQATTVLWVLTTLFAAGLFSLAIYDRLSEDEAPVVEETPAPVVEPVSAAVEPAEVELLPAVAVEADAAPSETSR